MWTYCYVPRDTNNVQKYHELYLFIVNLELLIINDCIIILFCIKTLRIKVIFDQF